tara:strand:- start:1122 stop:2180 length:1059 start_codon:yes stop_codon:yes gene_type:complete
MKLNPKLVNIIKSNIGIFLFITLFIILYRDFLYTYKIQLEQSIPYYLYQNHIEYYLTGDKQYDVEAPANLRFLGLWLQFAIYKIFPCIELSREINFPVPYDNYICTTFSSALMNYFCLCSFLSLSFLYSYKKLRLDLPTSILTSMLSYIFISYVEAFTLDRLAVLYFLIVLYFLDNFKLGLILIVLAAFVNEKVVYMLSVLFFIRLFLNKKKEYLPFFISSVVSSVLVIMTFVFYAFVLNHGYHESDLGSEGIYNKFFTHGFARIYSMFMFRQGYSNSVIPLAFTLLPYLLSFFIKLKKSKYFFSKLDILIPISLLLFTAGASMEQTGRYVMLSMPLWLPILSQQVIFFLRR